MEYSIQKLARIAGVSTRTLRYYDQIGLLKPVRINSSGYRIYGQLEVDKLQHILFYRELGMELEKIKEIINSPTFDSINALKEHREKLLKKREQLDILLTNVDKTITSKERMIEMADKEKFQGFKQKLIDENENKYGKETREKYGDDAVDKSNAKLKGMTQEEYARVEWLAAEIKSALSEAYKIGDPSGELAQKACDLHRQWLCFYWDGYTKEAHAGLGQMYVDDERFRAYYDTEQPGTAEFFRDAILVYTGMNK